MDIRIVTDSTCDLPEAAVEKYNITVVPLYINQGANAYLDGVDMTREEFYRKLPAFHPAPSTATPGPEFFAQVWNILADVGAQAILSIHVSEKLSATIRMLEWLAEYAPFERLAIVHAGVQQEAELFWCCHENCKTHLPAWRSRHDGRSDLRFHHR
jgi:DegV family protein with EDD domain